jgi:hypothetical protein
MSNDPSDYGGDVPPSGPTDSYGYTPDYPRLPGDGEQVRARVQPAAITLIVVAVLNLLFALYMVFNAVVTTITPARELSEAQRHLYEQFFGAETADKVMANKSPDDMKSQALAISWPWTVLAFVDSILTLLGAVSMLRLRAYTLSVLGSVAAVIPFVSCTACCGLGEAIGIWALVVLMNEEVKAAFR